MEIEGSKKDEQSKEGTSRRETFPACSHDYRIDADPFIRNIASNTVNPAGRFDLEAENLYDYAPDSVFPCDSSPVYTERMKGMGGIRNNLSRPEGASNMKTTRKVETYRGTIVAVSRDPVFLDSLHSILGNLGYRVVPADVYGYEVMEVLNEITPNLVIIDIGMPSMEGVQTTLIVRLHTEIPTILLTKWQTDKNTFRKLDAHSPDGLGGTITSDELVKLVDSVKMWHQDVNL